MRLGIVITNKKPYLLNQNVVQNFRK